MKNNFNARNLKKYNVLESSNGFVQINSDYDSFHGGYYVVDMTLDEDGNLVAEDNEHLMTLTDFIGYELI